MSSGVSFVGLIILLLFVVALVAGVLLIIFGLIGRSPGNVRREYAAGGKGAAAGACGARGYSVTGLESLACPECGSDLREVGIIKAGQANTGRNIMLVLGIVLVVLVLGCCVSGFFLGARQSSPVPHAPTISVPTVPAPTQTP